MSNALRFHSDNFLMEVTWMAFQRGLGIRVEPTSDAETLGTKGPELPLQGIPHPTARDTSHRN